MVRVIERGVADGMVPEDVLPTVTITDEDGNAISEPFADEQEMRIQFDCPICGTEREVMHTTPINDRERVACHTHATTYPLFALTLPPTYDDTVRNRIRIQLLSVGRIYPFFEDHPSEVAAIAGAPSAFVNATITTVLSMVGSFGIALGFPVAIRTDIRFTIGFLLILGALVFGLLSVFLGTGSTLYKGLLYVQSYDDEVGVREFILYASNYLNRRSPFVIGPAFF